MNNKKATAMTEGEMLREVLRGQRDIRSEISGHRKDLADHIKEGNAHNMCMQRQLSGIKESIATLASTEEVNELKTSVTVNKVKLTLIFAVATPAIASLFGYLASQWGAA